jgi:hypothetical protein
MLSLTKTKAEKTKLAPVREAAEALRVAVQQQDALLQEKRKLQQGLSERESRLPDLNEKELRLREEAGHYGGITRTLDPSLPCRQEEFTGKITALRAERETVEDQIAALTRQLADRERARTRCAEDVASCKRLAWIAIADALAAEFPPDFRVKFLKLWMALVVVHGGIHPQAVLERIAGPLLLETEEKVAIRRDLEHEFEIS